MCSSDLPMVMSLEPVAAQVGQTSEHTVRSRSSMFGAYEVYVSGTGVTGRIIPTEMSDEEKAKKPKLETMKVQFTVEPIAMPGVRDFRIATPYGASTIGRLVITRDEIDILIDRARKSLDETDGGYRPDAFTILDATAFFALTDALKLRAGIFNIFDEKYAYWQDVRGLSATSTTTDAYTRPGRNASVSLSFQF